jgi:hypothetical protein
VLLVVLSNKEGTVFILGYWNCVLDALGRFCRSIKTEVG